MRPVRLAIPDQSLVLLVGPSGAGKSTFAARHFAPTEIVSSDDLRARVADDANDQAASGEAFRILALIVNGRLRRRLLAVVDATNLRARNRRRLAALAARYGVPVVAIALDVAEPLLLANNRRRAGRQVTDDVVRDQADLMRTALAELPAEGYAARHVLRGPDQIASADVVRRPGAARAGLAPTLGSS